MTVLEQELWAPRCECGGQRGVERQAERGPGLGYLFGARLTLEELSSPVVHRTRCRRCGDEGMAEGLMSDEALASLLLEEPRGPLAGVAMIRRLRAERSEALRRLVQAVLLSKAVFATEDLAKKWCREHQFRADTPVSGGLADWEFTQKPRRQGPWRLVQIDIGVRVRLEPED